MIEQFAYLLTEEAGYDGWRSLVSTQTVGIGGRNDAGLQQSVMSVHAHQCLYDERSEAQVLLGCLTRCVQQDTVIG